ncbi:MAG: nucleoside triphosphate pyrophosphatase [Cyanobacteriota bacterium]
MLSTDQPLVLASASPARRRLLAQANIAHRVQVSGVDEGAMSAPDPLTLVQLLAAAKAAAVRDRLAATGELEMVRGVLGCDSLLVVEGDVYGKPADAEQAVARWQRMAGRWGELHTGHCLIKAPDLPDEHERRATVTTRVRFAPLDEAEIRAYVASGEPLQCAGGFALEGVGGLVVERIEGCVSNVIGLSLPLLRGWLAPGRQQGLPANTPAGSGFRLS